MPSLPDHDAVREVHLGAAIPVFDRHMGKAAQRVQRRHRPGGLADPLGLPGQPVSELGEQLVFQRRNSFPRRQDGVFQLLELRCDVALPVRQRLLADVAVGHLPGLSLGHLYVIPEDLVVTHPQGPDAGLFPLPRLNGGQRAGAAVHDRAQAVHLFMITLAN